MQCEVRRQRRSGPGGQHRNKVETGVFLRHRPSGIEVTATEKRSQAENQRTAISRLRIALATKLRIGVKEQQAPSKRWTDRTQNGRIHCSAGHEDFPAILAEALDFLAATDWEPSVAARCLQCTASQLIKLIKKAPPAWVELNQQRQDRGLTRLS